MKKVLIIIAALTISAASFAQDYNRAIGLRFGGGASVNYREFISNSNSYQIDLGLDNLFSSEHLNLLVSGTYLWHWGTEVAGLGFYAGPGASIGLHIGKESNALALSIDGLVGIEYKIAKVPLAISLDYRPQIGLVPEFQFYAYGVGLGIKYTF